jgi:hypothetical protein
MINLDNTFFTQSGGGYMPSGADIIKDYVTEFSRIQDWMIPIKDLSPETYESMHKRYIELKVTLTSLGVNITELDRIKA